MKGYANDWLERYRGCLVSVYITGEGPAEGEIANWDDDWLVLTGESGFGGIIPWRFITGVYLERGK